MRAPMYYAMMILDEPNTYDQAMKSPDKDKWKNAMNEEIRSLMENKTWILDENKDGKKPISCRWVYKIKRQPDGSVERYKARLVARGYSRRYGTDYHETFAQVVRFESVRIVLSLAAFYKMKIRQFDVKTAFLYGELQEKLLMEQPPGYQDGTNKVCRLMKGLYGLKQAPRQ